MAKKLPYITFFVGDWVKDTRMLSLVTRAIWMDMLCLMHDGDRRGHLSRHGTPLTTEQIAAFCGCSAAEVTRAVQELIHSGVCTCTAHGVLISRRMVRDEQKRAKCSEAGKKGATLKGHVKGEAKGALGGALGNGNGNGNGILFGEGKGGAGEGKGRAPPDFDLTPERLAQKWCFTLTRRDNFGHSADSIAKAQSSFAELIRVGVPAQAINAELDHQERDHDEQLYHIRDRLKRNHGIGVRDERATQNGRTTADRYRGP